MRQPAILIRCDDGSLANSSLTYGNSSFNLQNTGEHKVLQPHWVLGLFVVDEDWQACIVYNEIRIMTGLPR